MKLRLLVAMAAALACAPPAAAHDVPADVTVQAFLKPEGPRLRLLVRTPLAALRDVVYPTRGPIYLDLARADASLRQAANLWIADAVELYEDDDRLSSPRIVALRVSLPSDRSFGTYEDALAHVTGPPLPDDTEIYWSQAMLDVLFEYPIRAEGSRFSIHPGFGRLGLRVVTALRFLPPGGAVRAFELEGDPGLVRLDPRWHQAALRFVELGFRHILDGTDHLLFLLCLVIPFRRLRALVLVVTSFTVAHSITLVASAFGLAPDGLWFPPLVETLIAASIVYMALENVVVPQPRRRWMIAFGFGLVHGFGFSFALRQTLQFAGSHLLTSLLSFNLGVELGQLLVLGLLVPAMNLLFRRVPERMGTIVLSALVAHTGWHWMVERWDRLRQFRFPWPALDAAVLASATRWLMLAVVAAGLVWLGRRVLLPAARRRVAKEAE
jgi:HupE/UreJ protein